MNQRPASGLIALTHVAFVVGLVWTAFFLAWISLRVVDFGYPLLYTAFDINAHIAQYGPENEFKSGFESTSKEQRLTLFGEIVDAVHAGGQGLRQIQYSDAQGREIILLREPEVVHLISVARLLDRLQLVSWVMLVALVAAVAAMRLVPLPPPRARRVAAWSLVVVVVGALAVFALGPEHVFNTLHVWVFPAGEQWFFYYQESLMTTLMKAPDLFGAIAVLLLLTALAYGGGLLLACQLAVGSRFILAPR